MRGRKHRTAVGCRKLTEQAAGRRSLVGVLADQPSGPPSSVGGRHDSASSPNSPTCSAPGCWSFSAHHPELTNQTLRPCTTQHCGNASPASEKRLLTVFNAVFGENTKNPGPKFILLHNQTKTWECQNTARTNCAQNLGNPFPHVCSELPGHE